MKKTFEISANNISVSYYSGKNVSSDINGNHCHDKYEITYLISGAGSYNVEGSEHKLTRGSLMFIAPMSYHKADIKTDSDIELYTVHFDKEAVLPIVSPMFEKISRGAEGRGKIFTQKLLPDELISCFESFITAEKLNKAECEAYLLSAITQIIVLLSSVDGERMECSELELGARVAEYLNSNIEKELSLDRLAGKFFVSKYYLCRAFKNYSGIPLHAYVNQKRIMYAHRLIKSGVTASEAAERVGFGDYSAFYRAFVKLLGKSPTAD